MSKKRLEQRYITGAVQSPITNIFSPISNEIEPQTLTLESNPYLFSSKNKSDHKTEPVSEEAPIDVKKKKKVSFAKVLTTTIYVEPVNYDDTSHLYEKIKANENIIDRVRNIREQRKAKGANLFKFVDDISSVQNSLGKLNISKKHTKSLKSRKSK